MLRRLVIASCSITQHYAYTISYSIPPDLCHYTYCVLCNIMQLQLPNIFNDFRGKHCLQAIAQHAAIQHYRLQLTGRCVSRSPHPMQYI